MQETASAPAPPPRSRRSLAWVSTTYFGEGLPWTFLHQMATEYLTAMRLSSTQVSSTSLLHLAVTLKFLWSPVVDLFGRKRTWVWVMQILLGLGMIGIALIASPSRMTMFWAALGALAIMHAAHDIACDGFYIRALDRHDQALYSGVRTAAFRAAMLTGNFGLVYLASELGWMAGFSAAGVLMLLVALVNLLVMPHPPDTNASAEAKAAGKGRGTAFWAAYRTFLTQPQAVLVLSFMFLYRLGDIMMFAMSKPMLRDIGVDTGHRAILNGLGTTSFIVASLVGGGLIARFGLRRCFVPFTYIQNLAIPLYVGLAVFKPSFGVIIPIVLAEQFAAGIGNAGHVVFLMQRCRGTFSASHYAFATAVVSLGSTLSGFLSGPLNDLVGHPWFFTCAFLASVPSLVLVWIIPKDPLDAPPPPAPAR